MEGVCFDVSWSRHRPQVKRRWILWSVHRNSAGMDPILDTDLSIDRRTTSMLLGSLSLLTRPSVTATDGGPLGTDQFLVRGACTITAGSREAELESTLTDLFLRSQNRASGPLCHSSVTWILLHQGAESRRSSHRFARANKLICLHV